MILPGLSTLWHGAMLALGLAAVVPMGAGDLRPRPHPAKNYAEAVDRARRLIAADDSVVAEGGASILRAHGYRTPRAVVLLHGFTNSPKQFEGLADSLYAAGDNVIVPRLPRHAVRGKTVRELSSLSAGELCRAADTGVDIAAGLGDSVVVLGLSIGGTLALWSAEHRNEVRRAVIIAPPFDVTAVPQILERPLVNLSSHVPNVSRRSSPDSTRPDRLPGWASHALAQVIRLGMAVRHDADQATSMSPELLFLVNAHDHTVKTAPVLDVARAWHRRGAPASVYEIPDSLGLPHNIVDPRDAPPNLEAILPLMQRLAHGDDAPSWVALRR